MHTRWLWLGLLWLSTNTTHAQSDRGFTLQLDAPDHAGCISAATLTAEIEARTGRSSHARDASAAVSIKIQIDSAARGYRAKVSIQDSERELLADDSCSELEDMLVVVIASSVGITANQPAKRARNTARAPALQRTSASTSVAAEAPRPWRLEIDASARMLTASMPRPALGPALRLLAHWGMLGLRAGGSWLPLRSYPLQSGLALSAQSGLGELGLCGRAIDTSYFAALLCADVAAGAVRASVESLRHPTPRWDALVMLVPQAQARLRLSASFGVALAVGAAIPVIFPRYLYRSSAGEPVAAHAPELGLFAELALWLTISP